MLTDDSKCPHTAMGVAKAARWHCGNRAHRPKGCNLPRRIDSPDCRHLELPGLMILGHKLVELVERAEKDPIDLSGVGPQHAMHVHAPTCAGLHDRLRSLRGKVHLCAADGPDAGEKRGSGANALEIQHWRGPLSAPVKPARSRWCKSIALKV
jgi:hypothetical protein